MAILKIHSDIVDEQEKVWYEAFGMEAVSYESVNDFIDQIPQDDGNIDLKLHCNGGDCIEGWAIYDALRQSGKEISATIEGKCASMATIILLSAPKERRFATKNARICIHNPFIMGVFEPMTADKLHAQEQALREEQNRILDLYVERTGADRDELQALMNEDKFIDVDRAMALGFVGSVLEPNTASISHSKNNMENNVTIKASLLNRILAKLGLKDIEDFKVMDMVLTTATGEELTIERETGDPQVGDVASPDGSFVMEDGTTIVVEGGVIASITAPEPEPEEKPEAKDEAEPSVEELQAKIAELEAENAELKAENEELKAEPSEEDKKKAQADAEILDIVAKAGGREWLDAVCRMRSSYNANNPKFVEHKEPETKDEPMAYDTESIKARLMESAPNIRKAIRK